MAVAALCFRRKIFGAVIRNILVVFRLHCPDSSTNCLMAAGLGKSAGESSKWFSILSLAQCLVSLGELNCSLLVYLSPIKWCVWGWSGNCLSLCYWDIPYLDIHRHSPIQLHLNAHMLLVLILQFHNPENELKN